MDPPLITFRTAHASDSARVAALHTASWRSAYRNILSDSYLDGPIDDERTRLWHLRLTAPDPERYLVLVAEHTPSQNLVGFVCVQWGDDPIWGVCLDNLHVRPDVTGGGIGRLLLARAAHWVRAEAPASAMHLWVFEANVQARQFYDRVGGEVVERAMKPMPDGGSVPSLRYLWHDLRTLADAAGA
jgi:GNAT superfamily N-acetyltransferase